MKKFRVMRLDASEHADVYDALMGLHLHPHENKIE